MSTIAPRTVRSALHTQHIQMFYAQQLREVRIFPCFTVSVAKALGLQTQGKIANFDSSIQATLT